VELALASLMFLPIFVLIYQSTRLIYARLELIGLTRDAALYMIHEGKSTLPPGVLAELAKRRRLNPAQISFEVSSTMAKFLLGSRLTVRYHLVFSGSLGRMQPEGLQLSETVTFQSDCWKNFGLENLNQMFSL
jgi:hypothetical protein